MSDIFIAGGWFMWHYFKSSDKPRITLQSFLVDIDKLVNVDEPWPSVKKSNWIDYVRTTF